MLETEVKMIVWNFIYAQEGGLTLTGYVPPAGMASGVTLAAGVDLGWMKPPEFAQLMPGLRAKLRPYFGVKGQPARLLLREKPITITPTEADELMVVKKAPFLRAIHAQFDTRAKTTFDQIPDGPATAIMSLTWQYGNPWSDSKCGAFWPTALTCDWLALATVLHDFPDRRFISRRRREADFLRRAVGIYDGKMIATA